MKFSELKQRGWWDSDVEHILQLKEMIEQADAAGQKKIKAINTATMGRALSHVLCYSTFKAESYTVSGIGTVTDLTWE